MDSSADCSITINGHIVSYHWIASFTCSYGNMLVNMAFIAKNNLLGNHNTQSIVF